MTSERLAVSKALIKAKRYKSPATIKIMITSGEAVVKVRNHGLMSFHTIGAIQVS